MNCQPSFITESAAVAGRFPADLDWRSLAKLGRGDRGPERSSRRVPDHDIVFVGSDPRGERASDPIDVRELILLPEGAAPGAPTRTVKPSRRDYTKPLVAFLVLELAVLGGFYLSKRLSEAQVIVVPATTDERVVIT
jgi:hypothetical protein